MELFVAGYTLEPTHQSIPRRRKVTGFAREFEEPRCGLRDCPICCVSGVAVMVRDGW